MLCVCVSQYSVHLEETFSSLMFAAQASTLKIESKRNEVYSLNRSVDRTPKKSSETPIKNKTDMKFNVSKDSEYFKDKQRDDGSMVRILQEID